MIKIVIDSSALILAAKCGLAQFLCESYPIFAPSSVISEVASESLAAKHPDAALIAELVSKKEVRVRNPKRVEFQFPVTLHRGERDALLLAREIQNSLFATDDGKAIKAAMFLQIPFIITPRIVVDLFRLRKISNEEALKAIEKLEVIGRYSPDIIADALLRLRMEKK
jgi:predicted nucleic acid-binding protein